MFRHTSRQVVLCLCASIWLSGSLAAVAQDRTDGASLPKSVPSGVIIVKGAEASASDHRTPLPESGSVSEASYQNQYFDLSYPLPADWTEKYKGPPPSDSGSYVLAQLRPTSAFKGPNKATVLISAQDLFFSLAAADRASELIKHASKNLPAYFTVERQPTEVKIANHSFSRFDYMSPAADLHWYVLATEIRCHAVQFVFTSRDTKMLEGLIQNMDKMKLPAEAEATSGASRDGFPLCIQDYANAENVTYKVDPVLTDHRFNPIPVRIIIGTNGRVKHVHLLSAFPEQASAITDALLQWRFKPHMVSGEPVEVETGIMFGSAPARQQKPYPTPAEALKAGSQ